MPAHARCRAGIALTHQIPHPFEAMTVFENVLVGATHGGGRPERDAYRGCLAALELSGLAARANTRAGTLTLLERKRLELARALATRPRVLLLDEIAGGLTEPEVQDLVGVDPRRPCPGHGHHVDRAHRPRAALGGRPARRHRLRRALVEGPPDAVMASPEVQRVYLGIDVS